MELEFNDPSLNSVELSQDIEDIDYSTSEISVYSSKISHDTAGRSPKEIWESEREEYEEDELKGRQSGFLNKLARAGHMSVFYQSNVGLNLEVPRHTTMFLCQFPHSKYLQQSQRYTEASEFISDMDEAEELYSKQAELYEDMIEDGISKEDARYILPLGTAATHIHQNTNLTGLSNMYRVIQSDTSDVPGITSNSVDMVFSKLSEEEPVLFDRDLMETLNENTPGYPVANMFSEGNEYVDRLIEEKSDENSTVRFSTDIDEDLLENSSDEARSFLNLTSDMEEVKGYFTSMSLSAWHQFMRNDTVKRSVESVYDAAGRREVIVPPEIEESDYENTFRDLFDESMDMYEGLRNDKGTDAIEVVPHALGIGVASSFDWFNKRGGFVDDRSSKSAQWEIRDIARTVKEDLES